MGRQRRVSTPSAHRWHAVDTPSTRRRHAASTPPARRQRAVSTPSSHRQHDVKTSSARGQHAVSTPPARRQSTAHRTVRCLFAARAGLPTDIYWVSVLRTHPNPSPRLSTLSNHCSLPFTATGAVRMPSARRMFSAAHRMVAPDVRAWARRTERDDAASERRAGLRRQFGRGMLQAGQPVRWSGFQEGKLRGANDAVEMLHLVRWGNKGITPWAAEGQSAHHTTY